MPSSDYTTVVGGGLKLKGSKPNGIEKKKKKTKKPTAPSTSTPFPTTSAVSAADRREKDSETGLEAALKDEDDSVTRRANEEDEDEGPRDGDEKGTKVYSRQKTEAEMRHEEMRRRRVSFFVRSKTIANPISMLSILVISIPLCLLPCSSAIPSTRHIH